MERERKYFVTIEAASLELSPRDKIYYKDLENSSRLVDLVELEPFEMHVTDWVQLSVHNELAKDSTDYPVYVFIDRDTGKSVYTSSDNVFDAVFDIISDMEDEKDYAVKFYRKPSKNRKDQFYLAATIA